MVVTEIQKSRRGWQPRHSNVPSRLLALWMLVGATILPSSHSFGSNQWALQLVSQSKGMGKYESILRVSVSRDDQQFEITDDQNSNCQATESRRELLSKIASTFCFLTATSMTGVLTTLPSVALASPEDDVKETRALIQQAKSQLESVPALLKEEKWDGVRSVLMEAPLRDCWSKSTPILKKYAEALGETPKGDELAALEGREDLLQHLRFLDMAVYNNVFNPISTEGTTGASKALIDSYYNDPTRELDASMKAINELLDLSK